MKKILAGLLALGMLVFLGGGSYEERRDVTN